MVRLFLYAGIMALCAFISPLRDDRQKVRAIVGADTFLEIHGDCPMKICEQRDVKGLYKKARAGLTKKYTGISSPYQAPEHPGLRLEPGQEALADCVGKVVEVLRERGWFFEFFPASERVFLDCRRKTLKEQIGGSLRKC